MDELGSKHENCERFREHCSLIALPPRVSSRACGTSAPMASKNMHRSGKLNKKDGFQCDFQRHEAHPIYRDILDPISPHPKVISYWASCLPGIANNRYYRDISILIRTLTRP